MAAQLTQTVKAEQFYPTPPALIDRMLDKIEIDKCEAYLEPEAGKGDIAKRILRRLNRERRHCSMKGVSMTRLYMPTISKRLLNSIISRRLERWNSSGNMTP